MLEYATYRKVKDGYKGTVYVRTNGNHYIASATHYLVRKTRKAALQDAKEIAQILLKSIGAKSAK